MSSHERRHSIVDLTLHTEPAIGMWLWALNDARQRTKIRSAHIQSNTMKLRVIKLFLLGLFFSSQLLFPASAAPARPLGQSARLAPAAPGSPGLAFAGHIGGMPSALATNGTHLYAGQGPELTVLDAGNPAAPHRVGKSTLTGVITKLVVAGNRLYVAAGRLYVLDLTNPAAPAVIGSLDLGGNIGDLAIAGDCAYIIGQSGLYIANLANPAAPSLIGSYSSQNVLKSVAVNGQYAYLRVSNPLEPSSSYLEIVAVADSAHPTLASAVTFGHFTDMVFFGSYGLVARAFSGLDVISVVNPLQPAILAHRNTYASYISIVGSRAYIADTDPFAGGLRIFDISDPANPAEQGFYNPPGVVAALAGSGRYLYFFDAQDGFGIVDALNPAAPVGVGSLRTLIDPGQVTVSNSYAYIVEQPLIGDNWKGQPNGMKIVDVSNADQGSVVGVYRPAGTKANTITVAGNYAYIGTKTDVFTETGTLNIVNVADPTNPVEVAVYKIPGAVWPAMGPIVILDHYAYVGDHTKVHVVDVADPAHPQLVGSYAPAQGVIDCMAGQNGQIYLGLSNGDLEIIDISNPAAPAKAGAIATQYYVIDIAMAGQYAYVVSGIAADLGALYAIDISDPANPKQASRLDLDFTGQIAASGDIAYITSLVVDTGGVRVIDTSDPYHMRQASFYGSGIPSSITISGPFVYAAVGGYGLLILKAVTLAPRAYLSLLVDH